MVVDLSRTQRSTPAPQLCLRHAAHAGPIPMHARRNATLRSKAEAKSKTFLWIYGRVVLEQKGVTCHETFERAVEMYKRLGGQSEPLEAMQVRGSGRGADAGCESWSTCLHAPQTVRTLRILFPAPGGHAACMPHHNMSLTHRCLRSISSPGSAWRTRQQVWPAPSRSSWARPHSSVAAPAGGQHGMTAQTVVSRPHGVGHMSRCRCLFILLGGAWHSRRWVAVQDPCAN